MFIRVDYFPETEIVFSDIIPDCDMITGKKVTEKIKIPAGDLAIVKYKI